MFCVQFPSIYICEQILPLEVQSIIISRPLTGWLLHQSSILFNCYCSGGWQGACNADPPQSASPALTVCLLALSSPPSPSPVSTASRTPPSSIAWTRWTLLWSSAGACCCASRLPHQQRCVHQRRMRSRLVETAELIASLRRRLVPALILLAEVWFSCAWCWPW